jgi:NAD(P)-dependent dehydrogenase (short-subunit alcohol dehydrogenase family)
MTTVGIATGAGRGMGRACADRLAAMVDTLLLVDLDEQSVTQAAKDLAGVGAAMVEPVTMDVSDPDAVARLASRVDELGTLRAVAHAAGISPTMADWRRILTVDLVGTAMLAEALRPLATAGTAMVCFASMAAQLATSSQDDAAIAVLDRPQDNEFLERLHEAVGPSLEDTGMAYGWAKRGVQRFVQREATRLGPQGARICSISPGIIDTPQGRQEASTHEVMAEMVRRTPLGREGRAEELAAVVAFLLSDEASFVTGTDVLVDGGVCANLVGPASSSSG